jgi:hypothetical protein
LIGVHDMKRVFHPVVLVLLGFGLAACGSDSSSSPSATSTEKFTASLLPANEVPPITNDEAGGSATATVTFNVTKDSSGYATSATMDVNVTAVGFPNGTALTSAHIHPGGAGTNGGVFVNLALNAGEITFASGSGSFSRTGIPLTVEQINAILASPSNYYLNIHTALNPNGVARGQLTRAQ